MSVSTGKSSGNIGAVPAVTSSSDGPRSSTTHVVEARGLVKTFGHVIGLAGVDLVLDAGEVLGIIGENG